VRRESDGKIASRNIFAIALFKLMSCRYTEDVSVRLSQED